MADEYLEALERMRSRWWKLNRQVKGAQRLFRLLRPMSSLWSDDARLLLTALGKMLDVEKE